MKDQNEKKIGNLKEQQVDTENVKGGLSRNQSPLDSLDRKMKPSDFNKTKSPFQNTDDGGMKPSDFSRTGSTGTGSGRSSN